MELKVSGVMLKADVPNRNGHLYPAKVLRTLHDGKQWFWDEDKQTLSWKGPIEDVVNRTHHDMETIKQSLQTPKFVEVSLCDSSQCKSLWQVMLQYRGLLPPDNAGTFKHLPEFHESDKAFFEANWKGPATWLDIPATYENFMLVHHWEYAPRRVVRKPSGKPFKSGNKTAVVKRIVQNDLVPSAPDKDGKRVFVSKAAYEFQTEDEGYRVHVVMCEEVST